MENAAKALLIAAGVLIGIVILSALLMLYGQVSGYYQTKSDVIAQEQMVEFNKKFENYEDKEIRGNELLSVMNMIDDYNETEGNDGYKKMEIEINFLSTNIIKQFHFNEESGTDYVLKSSSTKITENKLDDFSDRASSLINELDNAIDGKSSVTVTETLLQQLSSNISNIVIDENNNGAVNDYDKENRNEARRKRANLVKSIFKMDITSDNTTYITKTGYSSMVNTIRKVTLEYYEFTQFKRAHFNCTGLEYDNTTGRIKKISFEVCKDSSGNLILN